MNQGGPNDLEQVPSRPRRATFQIFFCPRHGGRLFAIQSRSTTCAAQRTRNLSCAIARPTKKLRAGRQYRALAVSHATAPHLSRDLPIYPTCQRPKPADLPLVYRCAARRFIPRVSSRGIFNGGWTGFGWLCFAPSKTQRIDAHGGILDRRRHLRCDRAPPGTAFGCCVFAAKTQPPGRGVTGELRTQYSSTQLPSTHYPVPGTQHCGSPIDSAFSSAPAPLAGISFRLQAIGKDADGLLGGGLVLGGDFFQGVAEPFLGQGRRVKCFGDLERAAAVGG